MSKREKLYVGETAEFTMCDGRFRVTVEHDSDHGTPWENEDGHGEVSEWTRRDKLPGELVLSESRGSKRYYDFAGACVIARRDGWGIAPYRLDTTTGANGLVCVNAQWFEGRQLQSFYSGWFDDINAAIRAVYAAHRATFPSDRAYAAAAAMSDYNRLRDWCRDEWGYVGIIVDELDNEGEPTGNQNSLWGIESDAYDHLWEEAENLAAEMIAPQCAA